MTTPAQPHPANDGVGQTPTPWYEHPQDGSPFADFIIDAEGDLIAICGDRNNRRFIVTAAQRAEAFLRTLNLWKP